MSVLHGALFTYGCRIYALAVETGTYVELDPPDTRAPAKAARRGDILVLKAPGSLSLSNAALRDLNSSIYHTLGSVFPHIRLIPGKGRNLFLPSGSPEVTRADPQRIAAELRQREITAETALSRHIAEKLHPGWRGKEEEGGSAARQAGATDSRPGFEPAYLKFHRSGELRRLGPRPFPQTPLYRNRGGYQHRHAKDSPQEESGDRVHRRGHAQRGKWPEPWGWLPR